MDVRSNSLTWLHLSDLHCCKPKSNWDAAAVTESLVRDLEYLQTEHGLRPDFIFFTGDAAFGQISNAEGERITDQFQVTKKFFESVRGAFQPEVPADCLFLVPGNHDVNRDMVNPADTEWLDHQGSIDSITPHINEADALWSSFIRRLEDYRNFLQSSGYTHLLQDQKRLIYAIGRNVGGKSVGIVGLNTSWACSRDSKEEKGKLCWDGRWQIGYLFNKLKKCDLTIGLLHHPPYWFSEIEYPDTKQFLDNCCLFLLHGHEHQEWVEENIDGNTRIAAGACYDRSDKENSYNFVQLNLLTGKGEVWLRKYDSPRGWVIRPVATKAENGIWPIESLARRWGIENSPPRLKTPPHEPSDVSYPGAGKQNEFVLKKSFSDFLLASGAPFSHPRKHNLTIDDIYVPPDLEELSEKIDVNYIHSEKALDYLMTNNKVLLFGPVSSGKTSLLKVMFRRCENNAIVPLWIDGKSINTGNPERLRKLFEEAFESEYEIHWKDFWGLEPTKRALMIDDLQDAGLNRQGKLRLFDFISQHFGIVLISTGNVISIQDIIEAEKDDFLLTCKRVALSEFSRVTRSKLIEKWLLIGQEDTIKEPELDNWIKQIEEKCDIILRPSLAPSYPIYILTVAQSVDKPSTGIQVPFSEDRGSFGFFYEWLITTSLHGSPKKIADLNAKYRWLAELSYEMFQNRKRLVNIQELKIFHDSHLQRYSIRYIDLPYDEMVNDLISANILKQTDDYLEFRYPCIYYYFVGRALNTRLQQPIAEKHTKEIVSGLADDIDSEENECIILFLSYLSENPYIREVLLYKAKQMFSESPPADLDTDLDFINKEDLDLHIKLPEAKPKTIRGKIHQQEDEEGRNAKRGTKGSEFDRSLDEQFKPTMRASKMLRIMGQIAKNSATSLEGPDKYALLQESYLLGLRVLKKFLTLFAAGIAEFTQEVKESIRYGWEKEMLKLPHDRRHSITDSEMGKVARASIFFLITYVTSACIYAIVKSVGTVKLYPTFRDILDKYKSLMSVRLIDVGIKLDCQMQLPLDNMAEIIQDLEHNYVGRAILRRLAFLRLMLYETDWTEKQKCCKMLDIEQAHPRLYMPDHKIGKT